MDQISTEYDYIIAGAGSSGLGLAWHMIHSELGEPNILVIDKNLDPVNDKTWCFWLDGSHAFDHLIRTRWNRADVFVNGDQFSGTLSEYPYCCIRSGDFRKAILDELDKHPNVTLLEAPIEEMGGDEDSKQAWLKSGKNKFTARYIFQSCFPPSVKKIPEYPLIQHFLGWEVTSSSPVFNQESFTLMDFDETYPDGIAFMYVLPWSDQSALLEYTIFSDAVEPVSVYEKKLELYLHNKYGLKRIDYTIDRTEYGEIPMEDSIYEPWYTPNVMNLGRYGGLTKPSTGYTYSRIQDHSINIVESLSKTGKPATAPKSAFRYRSYDLWLLEIMHDYPDDALRVFHSLFGNNTFDEIFRFLGEDSSLRQDLKIMASVPPVPFIRAMWKTKSQLLEHGLDGFGG